MQRTFSQLGRTRGSEAMRAVRSAAACVLFGVMTAALCSVALAQNYPDKPIRLIVPYPPGTATDILARQLTPRMSEILGQPIVVDNRGGGGAIIGTEAVGKSAPDGYTLVMATSQTHAVNISLYKQLPYDPVADFTAVSRIAAQSMIFVVNASVPVKSVQEFVAYARAHPNKLNFASTGSGTSAHLSGELLNKSAGLNATHVPYKSAAQAIADLLGGEITLMFYPYNAIQSQLQAGKLVAIGNTGPQRSSYLPSAPTMVESGYPNFVITVWFGVYGPAGMPRKVTDVLNAALTRTMNDADVTARLAASGTDVYLAGPDEFARFTRSEIERYKGIIAMSGAKAD